MIKNIILEKISKKKFSEYGDIIIQKSKPDMIINQGFCKRYHDQANLEIIGGKYGISLFHAKIRKLPYKFNLLERHPLGSQTFIPLSSDPFLVIVAADNNGTPINPKAFITSPNMGINYKRNVWHGVLTPLYGTGIFAVVDRIGNDKNLEEYHFKNKFLVVER